MRLTLLVPELIWPEPDDQFTFGKLSAPALEWLLAHASLVRRPRRAFETVLSECCHLPAGGQAALRLLGESDRRAGQGHWLCADPVHLRFHHERIVLADAGAFDLDIDEARDIVASLNTAFADIGQFHATDARRWYLQLAKPVAHPVEPLSAVAGRRLDSALPTGDAPLTRWLNEVQMFLHGHPVNARRQTQRKPAINSLWLWGEGPLPRTSTLPFSSIWSDNPLASGIALANDCPLHAVPATAEEILLQGGKFPLVILDKLLGPVLYEDGQGWRGAFEKLESGWFAPLRQALGRRITHLELIAPTVYGELRFTLSAGERWKFWKRSQPLPALARQLASQS